MSGASDAFGELVTRYQTNVFNICCRILHERGEAEDLAQEIFMRAYDRLHALWKAHIAFCLINLSGLSYLQGNLEAFKQNFREGLSLKNYFTEAQKVEMLATVLRFLHFQKPECCARLLDVIDHSGREYDLWLGLISKRYCARAEAHAHKILGYAVFNATFSEGQNMSLDEALDLALKKVEEIE